MPAAQWSRRLGLVTIALLLRRWLPALALVASGCLEQTSEATFIGGADEEPCNGVYLECKGQAAGCVLDEEHYIGGSFPGEVKFLVETPQGDWKIVVRLFLAERLSPGTETEVRWNEPGCTDEYRYRLSEHKELGDLFEQAGRDQVFEVDRFMVGRDRGSRIALDGRCHRLGGRNHRRGRVDFPHPRVPHDDVSTTRAATETDRGGALQ